LGEINRKAKHAKKHFWATFSDGEYKCPHLDAKDPLASAQKNGYGTHWLLVRARTHACTHARTHARCPYVIAGTGQGRCGAH